MVNIAIIYFKNLL